MLIFYWLVIGITTRYRHRVSAIGLASAVMADNAAKVAISKEIRHSAVPDGVVDPYVCRLAPTPRGKRFAKHAVKRVLVRVCSRSSEVMTFFFGVVKIG